MRTRTREGVLAETKVFISVWWASSSMDEVVAMIGRDRRFASNMAAYLRSKGVQMKAMPFARDPTRAPLLERSDYEELRRVAEHEAKAHELRKRYRQV